MTTPQRQKRATRPDGNSRAKCPTPNHLHSTGSRCPTSGKVRFRERNDAKLALTLAAYRRTRSDDSGEPRRREVRTYRCAACRGWHLTSMPAWASTSADATHPAYMTKQVVHTIRTDRGGDSR